MCKLPSNLLKLFKPMSADFRKTFKKVKFPTKNVSAGTKLFRIIPKLPLDYHDIVKQIGGPGRGSDSTFNRWSGRKEDGLTKGVSGSYWGSTDGVAAESFFYSCLMGYDPDAGAKRILPGMSHLIVAGVNQRQPYMAEQGAPPTLPRFLVSEHYVLIASLIRTLTVVDMDGQSEKFQDWNDRMTRLLKPQLDGLGMKTIAEALNHPEMKEISRLLANVAYEEGGEALLAKSVRQNDFAAESYNPDNANNIVLFGNDNQPLTGTIVLTGAIELSSDPTVGTVATLKPVTVFPPKEDRRIVHVPQSVAAKPVSGSSAAILDAGSVPASEGSEGSGTPTT